MKFKNIHSTEDGFTLVELMVYMLLLIIMVTFIYGSYVVIRNISKDWDDNLHIENTFHLMVQQIQRDFQGTRRLRQLSAQEIELEIPKGRIFYQVKSDTLFRNNVRMHDKTFWVSNFSIKALPDTLAMPFDANTRQLPQTLIFDIGITDGEHALETREFVVLRNAIEWNL